MLKKPQRGGITLHFFLGFSEATCCWSGTLPARSLKSSALSCKVFLGGVPWDVSEPGLVEAFAPFGNIKIQWPSRERSQGFPPKAGYVYIIFESEKQVKMLLQSCSQDFVNGGNWYYKISSRRMRCKEVQVIPWVLSDSNYVRCPSHRLDPSKTVFVGALHGMLNAQGLAHVMNELFGGVLYSGIDTDKYKYPIGGYCSLIASHVLLFVKRLVSCQFDCFWLLYRKMFVSPASHVCVLAIFLMQCASTLATLAKCFILTTLCCWLDWIWLICSV